MLFILILPLEGLNTTFYNLRNRMINQDTLVCVGLDPDISRMPSEIMQLSLPIEEKVYLFLTSVIDITATHVCAYKLQKAFYDNFEQGHTLLIRVIGYIKQTFPGIPVFIDCKIGDTENTMAIYIHNLFDQLSADGIVVNPYMGDDVFLPFQKDPNKIALVMVQTSNLNAKIIQEMRMDTGCFFWERVLELTLHRWNTAQNIIVILSSNTFDYNYKSLRQKIPKNVPILLAGIGAQGGNLSALKDLLNDEKIGVFINSSRDILYPYSPENSLWKDEIFQATLSLKKQINGYRL